MTLPQTAPPDSTPPGEVRVPVLFKMKAKNPVVTYVILAVTIVVYAIQYLSQSLAGGYDWPFLLGGKINALILHGQVWRLVTPVLLHASLLHLGFNMYALYTIGTSLERFYGHGRFLALYLIAGYAGNALSFLLSDAASLGASTAIFGLVIAEAVLIYKNKRMFGSRAKSMLINLGVVIAINLMLGFSAGSQIDNWGHLGGLIGGLAFAWVAGPFFKVQTNTEGALELKDAITREQLWWGFLLSAGLFTAVVIGKFITG